MAKRRFGVVRIRAFCRADGFLTFSGMFSASAGVLWPRSRAIARPIRPERHHRGAGYVKSDPGAARIAGIAPDPGRKRKGGYTWPFPFRLFALHFSQR